MGIIAPPPRPSPAPIFVPDASTLTKLRSGVANVVSGTSRFRVAVLGDSTDMGHGSGTGQYGDYGARTNSPSAFAAKYLTARGVPARADAFAGNANALDGSAASYTLYNPAVTLGTGWSAFAGAYIGNGFWQCSTGTAALGFTPSKAADRFEIHYATGSGFGTFTVTDASGTLATVNTAGAAGVGKTVVTRAAADLTPISIQRNGTGAAIYIGLVDPWNSTLPEVCILNLGVSGGQASAMLSTAAAFGAKYQLDLLAPDWTSIGYGLNEKSTGVTLSAFTAFEQSLITQQLANSGGVNLCVATPGQLGNSINLTPDWQSSLKSLGSVNRLAVVDYYSAFGSREVDTSLYFDLIHLTKAGSAKKGKILADLLLT